jgi:ectoine hydroxylase-related dioxygenase (phytanoyl-CoA dioxygenase family)
MTDIHKDGYIILKNILSDTDMSSALSSTIEDKVDYIEMKKFIDDIFFTAIKKNQNFIKNPQYVKFRYSNNNNSKDASLFHGDIYNHSDMELLPIYTCLCYFDDTRMEIIPGSHIKTNDLSIQSYHKKIELQIEPGDVLIFHANIHHRGVNFDKKGDRRILQVFDVFPDMKTYKEHSPKLIIVKPKELPTLAARGLYEISKYPIMLDPMSFFHYQLMYYDLQYKLTINDISPSDKKGKYVSYEPNERAFIEDVEIANQNINIICDKTIRTLSHTNHYAYIGVIYVLLAIGFCYMCYVAWFSDYNAEFRGYMRMQARQYYILRTIRQWYKNIFYDNR